MTDRFVVGAALVVGVLATERAHACSDSGVPACIAGGISVGEVLPANAPGIPFWPGDSSSGIEPSLFDASGTLWPTSIVRAGTRRFLVPSTPLTESANWTIKYTEPCSGPTEVARTFTTSTNKPMPTSVGTLAARVGRGGPDSCGTMSVGDEGVGNAAHIVITTPPEIGPFAAVVSYEYQLDGVATEYSTLWTDCGTFYAARAATTTPGKHTFSARAVIANGPATPWVDVEFTLTCGSSTDSDAGVIPDADEVDAATDTGVAEMSGSPTSSASSCAFPGGRGAGSFVALSAFGLAAFAARRRRAYR